MATPPATVGMPPVRVQLDPLMVGAPLTIRERYSLCQIAASTWQFFSHDVNSTTDLPMDNMDFDGVPATDYTSPADIAAYLWSVVAAEELNLVTGSEAQTLAGNELVAVGRLQTWDGLPSHWYSATTGQPIAYPGGPTISTLAGQLIPLISNAELASALVIVREAFPALFDPATQILDAMDFKVFYDNGNQASNIYAGGMYGGYYADGGPGPYVYNDLNTDDRFGAYLGMGLGQLPGDVWWRSWLTPPLSISQTETPMGPTVTYDDPDTGQAFPVFEGHYSYDGIDFVPSYGGSEFEGLVASLIVPETTWGPESFGRNDVNYAEAEIAYAKDALHYPVWGLAPASTPGLTGGYTSYGANPLGVSGSYTVGAVTPYASFLALPVAPQQAFDNIEKMVKLYPSIVGPYGLFDSVDPTTGEIAPRYLALDQGMIMVGIDDALTDGGLQQYFAADPVGQHDEPYLSMESFALTAYPGTHRSAGPPNPPGR